MKSPYTLLIIILLIFSIIFINFCPCSNFQYFTGLTSLLLLILVMSIISFIWADYKFKNKIDNQETIVGLIAKKIIKYPDWAFGITVAIALLSAFFVLSQNSTALTKDTYFWYYGSLIQGFASILALLGVIFTFKFSSNNEKKGDKKRPKEQDEFRDGIIAVSFCIFVIIIMSIFGMLISELTNLTYYGNDFRELYLLITFCVVIYTLVGIMTIFSTVIRGKRKLIF